MCDHFRVLYFFCIIVVVLSSSKPLICLFQKILKLFDFVSLALNLHISFRLLCLVGTDSPNHLDVLLAEPGKERKRVEFWLQAKACTHARHWLKYVISFEFNVGELFFIEDCLNLNFVLMISVEFFHFLNFVLICTLVVCAEVSEYLSN